MVQRARSWAADHAGILMALLMFGAQAVGISWWASALTTEFGALQHRVEVVETGRAPLRAELAVDSARLERIEQKINDLSNYVKGEPPQ